MAKGHRLKLLQISHQVWGQSQYHRSLPFAGMPHLVLLQARLGFPWPGAELPISCEQQKQIAGLPMPLADFKDSLPAWHIVSAVTIDKNQATKTVLNEVLQ